jgi:hypothetical protein
LTIDKYSGIPNVILNGKVMASAIGKNKPGFAFGAEKSKLNESISARAGLVTCLNNDSIFMLIA